MERSGSAAADSIISNQQKQLARYENRMKDLVAAYKSLLKEKEALEASVAALTSKSTVATASDDASITSNVNKTDNAEKMVVVAGAKPIAPISDDDNLKMQISTVMNSLATLSAEKSKMEASFQADKKQLRLNLAEKDKLIRDIQDESKVAQNHFSLELEKAKSKLIVERHEREKETNNHMLMVRELQKLLSDERHLKENLEMQLSNLKVQFSQSDNSNGRIKELTTELDQVKQKIKEIKSQKTPVSDQKVSQNILRQLQNEIVSLKQQHSAALKTEQRRAIQAEDQHKKLSIVHEDRVANLESRLAELSVTVGTYDRMRNMDQESISKLKEKIVQLEMNGGESMLVAADRKIAATSTSAEQQNIDMEGIIDEINQLKKLLLIENAKLKTPKDLSLLFSLSNDHLDCQELYEKLKSDFDQYKRTHESNANEIEVQKTHIKTLQSKVQVLNRNIDEQETEIKLKINDFHVELKAERQKWKEIVSSVEMEYRSKIAELEQQLQKQRERSLCLLEEKENEIKSLKSTFDVFMPNNEMNERRRDSDSVHDGPAFISTTGAAAAGANAASASGSNTTGSSAEFHMLHYAHELSRKEVEIVTHRKARHAAESSLRQALQDKVTSQGELHDKIIQLEETVDRLKRCQSREGANLEYLKNVILRFLVSNDADSKRHMVNAIAAVLKFSPRESKMIASTLK